MKYRKLGNTEIEVSEIAFGCWAVIGGFNWGYQNFDDSIKALQTAYECGVTFFDTAEKYGDGKSEQLLGKVLGKARDEIIIASKVAEEHLHPLELKKACERSLINLKTDRIDLYQVHWMNSEVPIFDTFEMLEQLKSEGKIRSYGVSNFGINDLSSVIDKNYSVASDQLPYNLLFRATEYKIKEHCIKNDVSILCYSPLMQGLLTGKFSCADNVPVDRARSRHFSNSRRDSIHGESGAEVETFRAINAISDISREFEIPMLDLSLGWLLEQKGVSSVIFGARNADQTKKNINAAKRKLPQEIVRRLSEATLELKTKLGQNADMWQSCNRIK